EPACSEDERLSRDRGLTIRLPDRHGPQTAIVDVHRRDLRAVPHGNAHAFGRGVVAVHQGLAAAENKDVGAIEMQRAFQRPLTASTAQKPALPRQSTTTSAASTPADARAIMSAHPVEQAVIEADNRQEPRAAIVKRNRGEVIVEQRVLEVLAGHPPRDEAPEV